MNNKEFFNIVVIALVVLLVGATGYFVLTRQPMENIQNEPEKQTNPPVKNEPTKGGEVTEPAKKPIDSNWTVYSKTNQWFGYSTEYPFDWSIKEFGTGEIGTGVYFLPPGETSKQKSISLMIINYEKTPPLPVLYTYTTLRKIKSGNIKVLVQKREPELEQYIATIEKGYYTTEFRFRHGLDSKYDSVFDHIVSSFVWTK